MSKLADDSRRAVALGLQLKENQDGIRDLQRDRIIGLELKVSDGRSFLKTPFVRKTGVAEGQFVSARSASDAVPNGYGRCEGLRMSRTSEP